MNAMRAIRIIGFAGLLASAILCLTVSVVPAGGQQPAQALVLAGVGRRWSHALDANP